MRQEHHGLIVVPMQCRADGIYWLRFYRSATRCVAVLTEVPGNPGLSITNGIEQVCEHVAQRFSVPLESLEVFQVWPRGSCRDPDIKRVTFTDDGQERTPGYRATRDAVRMGTAPFTGRPEWWDAAWADLQGLAGNIAPLPPHDELYGAVRALGGGRLEEIWRDVFEAVAVEDLPPPHNPSSCRYAAKFNQIEERLAAAGEDDPLVVGRAFLETLTPAKCARCRFHKADWRAIADESAAIVQSLGRCDQDAYIDAAQATALPEREASWLVTLFHDPVFIGGGSYTNGQHRGCALRFSGATHAAVVTDTQKLGEFFDDWTYEGDG